MNLRSNLIRLAYANPSMRKDLLPIIQREKSASDRMEVFEDLEGFAVRLRNHADWKRVLNEMDDALDILGEGDPATALKEAQRQVVLAKTSLDNAIQILRKW